eukprot:TRINITY_DN7731_c0_g4_i1.p1 TRINITY_DN7731_c0_g4~~TRINITY_DN7731_c0_g4_i1.p1  ORF type:complete len:439 (+),score=104.98 TRINITY_DN7731_c0_g4_i1:25-1341(+)
MWPGEIKSVISEDKAREIWRSVVFYGIPFVEVSQAENIISLVQKEKPTIPIPVEEVLQDWNRRSKRSGWYGYNPFIQSFATTPAEVNPFKEKPRSPTLSPRLQIAVSRNDEAAVRKLLLAGADPNYNKDMNVGSILYEALVGNSPITIVKMLLQAGADLDYLQTEELCSHKTTISCFDKALDLYKNDTQLVELLLEYGGDPNRVSQTTTTYGGSDGYMEHTPLHTAIRSSNISAIKALLEAGADPNIPKIYCVENSFTNMRTNDKMPCLTLVLYKNYDPLYTNYDPQTLIKIMQLLLQHGENIDQLFHFLKEHKESKEKDSLDRKFFHCAATTLHIAVKRNEIEIIKFLVRSGANPDIPFIRDKEKISTLQLCKSQEAINSLSYSFQSRDFSTLIPQIQHYILTILLIQTSTNTNLPTDINSLLFTNLIHIYWYKHPL